MNRCIAIAGLLLAVGCSKKKVDGLAPAENWSADPGAMAPEQTGPLAAHGGATGTVNPHEGLDMSQVGGDPGINMGAGGTDVSKLGLAAPDPNRQIDPNHHVRGTLSVDPKAASHVTAGGALFLIVKHADASGAPTGPPLAVEKMTWQDGEAFDLTEAQAMIAGTELTGDVVVMARFDHDGDALSKQPGDVTGVAHVTLPADNVKLVLDTVLP